MIFGRKEQFAIEMALEQREDLLLGRMCLHIAGQVVGYLDEVALLSSCIACLERDARLRGKRQFEDLKEYDYRAGYNYLSYEVWGVGEESVIVTDYELMDCDILVDGMECFDGSLCYLIELGDYDWLLWGEEKCRGSYKLPPNVFHKTVGECLQWIRESTRLVLR